MLTFPLNNFQTGSYATLAFFDIFDFPLTVEEIQFFFLGKQPTKHKLQKFLEKEDRIGHTVINDIKYYFLKGRSSIVHTRLQRKRISAGLWRKVQFFLPFIQMVPFIKMVSVCNTLAFNNATKDSDIDLFIVAGRGRLFIVRFFTLFLFSILGVRRHGKKIAGRFCLSFYVDEDFLNLEPIQLSKKDIYLPFWIITMKPIYGQKIYGKFLEANKWIKQYFCLIPEAKAAEKWNILKYSSYIFEFILNGKFGNFIERKFEEIQRKRHGKNFKKPDGQSSVVVEKHILKFHNMDRRVEIAGKFEKRLHDLAL